MNRLFIGFIIFLFGVMAGYAWQYYHHSLVKESALQEVKTNRLLITELDQRIEELTKELTVRQHALEIIMCESSMRHDVYGDGGKSFGWAQFQKRTFKWMAKEAGYEKLQWKNPYHQLILLEWALRSGYGEHWTCYKGV